MSEMPTPLRGAGATAGRERLVSLDLLRVAVVAMVIVHHAAQPYGPSGPSWPVTDTAQSDWFRPFYTVNAALGLGLLFLLAGHFVPPAHDRKGPRRFLRDRWSRLGVPMVVFVVAANLPIALAIEQPDSLAGFVTALYDDAWTPVYLHLWFVLHLLLYSLAYVAWRRLTRGDPRPWAPPRHGAILAFAVGLAVVTWVVRWWFPIDEWVPLAWLVPVEPARLPQYVGLFVVGVLAYRGDWVRGLRSRVGGTWLVVGLAASVCMAVVQSAAPDSWRYNELANAGPGWQSLLRAGLESLVCVGLAVGLIVLFRDLVRRPRPWITALAATSYAAYVLHLYIVVPLQVGMTGPDLSPFVKFGVVAALALLLSFGAARGSRRVPGLRRLLGTAPSRPGTGSTDESPRPGRSTTA